MRRSFYSILKVTSPVALNIELLIAIVVSGVTTLVMGGNYAFSTGSYGDYQVDKAFLLVERNNITVIRGVMVKECEDIVRF